MNKWWFDFTVKLFNKTRSENDETFRLLIAQFILIDWIIIKIPDKPNVNKIISPLNAEMKNLCDWSFAGRSGTQRLLIVTTIHLIELVSMADLICALNLLDVLFIGTCLCLKSNVNKTPRIAVLIVFVNFPTSIGRRDHRLWLLEW